jgi:hypothetical protein
MLIALSPVASSSALEEREGDRGRADRYGTVLSILPPGQSGTSNAAELAQVAATDQENRIAVEGENAPPNFADQLEMYDAINTKDPSSLTFADLVEDYYKHAGFEPDTGAREETPRSGVRIRWDDRRRAPGDLVDTVVERLCNADGSRATERSTSCRVAGSCVPMRHDVHEEQDVQLVLRRRRGHRLLLLRWLPDRAEGVDFDRPRWGDRRFDWQGRRPSSRHPSRSTRRRAIW